MSNAPTVVTPTEPIKLVIRSELAKADQPVETNAESVASLPQFSLRLIDGLTLVLALVAGSWIWNLPPVGAMGGNGMHFLATMTVAVAIWILDVLEEYIVGLALLLAWVVLGIVPSKVALAGFSENSWFFTVGALGIAAAIGQTHLLHRLTIRLLRLVPIHWYKTYTLLLLSSGVAAGPLLPTGKARTAVAVPVGQAVSEAAGFEARSNGSAAIALSAFIGFSQMSFMFLTGGEHCLIGWNFLPSSVKAEFGWLSWFLAAFPAAVCISLTVFISIHGLFPLSPSERSRLAAKINQPRVNDLGPIGRGEWLTLTTLLLTVAGWLTTSFHGINEAWVALAALLVFLLTGILDKNSFKNKIDWGLVLFFGVLNSMAVVASHLKVDAWFTAISGPFLAKFTNDPFNFLLAVFLLVSFVRLVLRKTPAAAFSAVTLLPLSSSVGIHPGLLVVVVIMAGECFLLGYQDGPYQIAYAGTGGRAFSHSQARKVLAAKYLATLLAIAVSVPYWRFLGLIR